MTKPIRRFLGRDSDRIRIGHDGGMPAPVLDGDALDAVRHRGSHLQIIAAAGSGKTEVVSQRVVDLLADRVNPAGIVAFTFTKRAAAELRHRIAERAEERLGRASLGTLGGLFVGTIHSYCFRLLQTRVPRYETYDVLDDHQLTAFLAREATRLDLKRLDHRGRLFGSIDRFLQGVDDPRDRWHRPSPQGRCHHRSWSAAFGRSMPAVSVCMEDHDLMSISRYAERLTSSPTTLAFTRRSCLATVDAERTADGASG